jgi:hypothetical protein
MTSLVPELDDIDFDRLVEDGRGLIPRYAPKWTDHNPHDPGITLIDLIAFLVDQQVYRIGFVGDRLIAAFTRLMGIAPRGPEPAEILIWPHQGIPVLNLSKGTRVTSPDAPDAHFTLSQDIRTIAPKIVRITRVRDGVRKPLGTGLTEGLDPLELLPAWGGGPQMLEFELDAPIPPLVDAGKVSLGVELRRESGGARGAGDPITLEQWNPAGFWRPLETQDATRGLRQPGILLFDPDPDSPAERFRLRLDQGFRPGAVRLLRLALNVLPAREGRDDLEAVIGEGTGLPDQRVELKTEDIVRETSLVIETDIGGTWERRDDLTASGPNDAHYRLSRDGIVFGNGLNGRTVPLGAQIRMGRVRRTCGTSGAVAAGLEWTIVGTDYGTNIAPSTPGRDRDTLQDLIAGARGIARTRPGALHSDAIREFLLAAGLGLADVQVIPRRRPGLERKDAPGSRTILILPVRDPAAPPGPPRERLREEVETALVPLRLLGERLYVSSPIYVSVDVEIYLIVDPDADVAALKADAEATLRARLWDLPLSPGISPWQPGRDVTVGEIEGLMAARLPQIVRIPDCRIARSGATPTRDPVVLDDREIAIARRLALTVTREGRAP